ncbi:MAG: hypothetical protein K0R13_436 [Propionibacteriaceae bacterium]|nr:hypothetical protein [Propionibacteriaceae bacterium]
MSHEAGSARQPSRRRARIDRLQAADGESATITQRSRRAQTASADTTRSSCPLAVHPREAHAQIGGATEGAWAAQADCSRTRRSAPGGRWLAAEVEDLLKWRESGFEVDAVDLKAVLTKPAVEGILRGGYAG